MARAVLAVLLLVVIGALWWLATGEPRPSDALGVAGERAAAPTVLAPNARAGSTSPVASQVASPAARAQKAPDAARSEPPAATLAPRAADEAAMPAPQAGGPIAELKQRFENDPRDSAAAQLEALIDGAFRDKDVPAGLLKSVLCRQSVCKLELRWSSDRNTGYMLALTRVIGQFDRNMAILPLGAPDADGVLPLEVYLPRQSKDPAP
jgi:hypothetical protein